MIKYSEKIDNIFSNYEFPVLKTCKKMDKIENPKHQDTLASTELFTFKENLDIEKNITRNFFWGP